jgi:hypothetical protein
MNDNKKSMILGLDISTKCIGISLFESKQDKGELKILKHVSPVVKPVPKSSMEVLFKKANVFRNEFLNKYVDLGIVKVIIEEPLLRSNNVNTVGTLLRFNGMVARDVYEILGVVPEFISSYDSRKYAYPELMAVRTHKKKDGTPLTPKEIAKNKPTLFGAYDDKTDKKMVIWEKVADLEPQIEWFYDKNKKLKTENFDMTDAYTCVRAVMKRDGHWK